MFKIVVLLTTGICLLINAQPGPVQKRTGTKVAQTVSGIDGGSLLLDLASGGSPIIVNRPNGRRFTAKSLPEGVDRSNRRDRPIERGRIIGKPMPNRNGRYREEMLIGKGKPIVDRYFRKGSLRPLAEGISFAEDRQIQRERPNGDTMQTRSGRPVGDTRLVGAIMPNGNGWRSGEMLMGKGRPVRGRSFEESRFGPFADGFKNDRNIQRGRPIGEVMPIRSDRPFGDDRLVRQISRGESVSLPQSEFVGEATSARRDWPIGKSSPFEVGRPLRENRWRTGGENVLDERLMVRRMSVGDSRSFSGTPIGVGRANGADTLIGGMAFGDGRSIGGGIFMADRKPVGRDILIGENELIAQRRPVIQDRTVGLDRHSMKARPIGGGRALRENMQTETGRTIGESRRIDNRFIGAFSPTVDDILIGSMPVGESRPIERRGVRGGNSIRTREPPILEGTANGGRRRFRDERLIAGERIPVERGEGRHRLEETLPGNMHINEVRPTRGGAFGEGNQVERRNPHRGVGLFGEAISVGDQRAFIDIRQRDGGMPLGEDRRTSTIDRHM